MTYANERQVGGTHYRNKIQHWDWVASNELDYFQGQITKYVSRWKNKNGIEDLEKAQHFLEKYIEIQKRTELNKNQRSLDLEGSEPLAHGYVNQD
jgi:hypothetical protein